VSAPDPLAAAARGLAVFPLPAGGRGPCPSGWQRTATTDPAALIAWPAGANIGVGCWASQLVVLDLDAADDRHGDGRASLARLAAEHGRALPVTLTVATPSGGAHLYYRYDAPGGPVIGSSSGGRSALGPGIDIRGPGAGGRGGYVLGPTSQIAGRAYAVEVDAPITGLPAWIAVLLTNRHQARTAAHDHGRTAS
jgi:bifunctional DNA primase/polymerase-like protein